LIISDPWNVENITERGERAKVERAIGGGILGSKGVLIGSWFTN